MTFPPSYVKVNEERRVGFPGLNKLHLPSRNEDLHSLSGDPVSLGWMFVMRMRLFLLHMWLRLCLCDRRRWLLVHDASLVGEMHAIAARIINGVKQR
ncbi:hypothetical protein DTW90_30790 [Neorhizobium sp. P12A]|nr:hypothetical protein DTW90_30790 [Neorhizobium sp. P12A]